MLFQSQSESIQRLFSGLNNRGIWTVSYLVGTCMHALAEQGRMADQGRMDLGRIQRNIVMLASRPPWPTACGSLYAGSLFGLDTFACRILNSGV